MKKLKKKILILILIVITMVQSTYALTYPQLHGYVTDNANIITSEYRNNISDLTDRINKKTKVEIAVLTIDSLEGDSIENYAINTFRQNGIGENGILILVSKNDRKYRFEVGYGVEGTIPDAVKVSIRDNIIVPNFRNGDYGKGIYESILVIEGLVNPINTPIPTLTNSPNMEYSASINFYGEKTDVNVGEDILLKLSIVNLVPNPKMSVQVIIFPSSGIRVTSAEFTQVSAGQFVSNYDLNPGNGREIEIKLRSNQVGEFNIKGRVVYYFGDKKDKTEEYIQDLPIKVRQKLSISPIEPTGSKSVNGFAITFGIWSLLLIYKFKKYKFR